MNFVRIPEFDSLFDKKHIQTHSIHRPQNFFWLLSIIIIIIIIISIILLIMNNNNFLLGQKQILQWSWSWWWWQVNRLMLTSFRERERMWQENLTSKKNYDDDWIVQNVHIHIKIMTNYKRKCSPYVCMAPVCGCPSKKREPYIIEKFEKVA